MAFHDNLQDMLGGRREGINEKGTKDKVLQEVWWLAQTDLALSNGAAVQ
jgi:hypothetical protein